MYSNVTLNNVADYSDKRINIKDVPLEDFVTTDNMLQNKLGITTAVKLPPQDGNMPMYKKGNILVANIRPYLKKIWFADKDGGCSSDVLVFDVMDEYDPKFVYYTLLRDDFFVHMMKGSKGTKMPRGDKAQIMDFVIPKIEIDEQQKIASILSTLDKKIELNNKINKELEAMAKTLYEYWFVQFDFPDTDGKPYKSSGGNMAYSEELKREIPEGWKSGIASDLFDFNPTMSLAKGSIGNYIDMNALPTEGYMTKDIQKKEFNGGVKFQNGDLVMARITPCLENGKTGLVTLLDEEIGFGSTEFIVLRGKEISLSSYASCLSRSELFRKYAIANMTGTSGRKRVDAKALEVFSLAIPTDDILKKFEEIGSPFFDKMTSNTKENQKLTQLRDWLLPMLMNGQVKVAEHGNVSDELMVAEPVVGYGESN